MAEDSLVEIFVDGIRGILNGCSLDEDVVEAVCKQLSQGSPFKMDQKILDLIDRLNTHIMPVGKTEQLSACQSSFTQEQISQFIGWKRKQINESNLVEFLGTSTLPQTNSCSRLDSKKINRSCQIKTAVVENWEGPLDRTTLNTSEPTNKKFKESKEIPNFDQTDALLHLTPNIPPLADNEETAKCSILLHEQDSNNESHIITTNSNSGKLSTTNKHVNSLSSAERYIIEQRLLPVEQHLKLKSHKLSLLERIKLVEDKIVNIECNYPFLAYYHFNYCSTSDLSNSHRYKEQFESDLQQLPKDNQLALSRPSGKQSDTNSTGSKPMMNEEQVYQKLCGMKRKLLGNSSATQQ